MEAETQTTQQKGEEAYLDGRQWSSVMHVLNAKREEPPKHHEHANTDNKRKKEIKRGRVEEEEGAEDKGALAVAEEEEAGCTKVFKKRPGVL